ncbi:MAG: hypothetical protein H7124_05420 [Phycisphaerales bacterium]|nr:hypothetical protein [Hyphomonadaceae bacterium]
MSDALALNLLPGVPADYVFKRLSNAPGKELVSGKFVSANSSAALAANCFGWFHPCAQLLPPFAGVQARYPALSVDIEACVRFPWSGGRHPWLDALVTTERELIGIESKRYEPFRDKKKVDLSSAYDRPVWGDAMQPFEKLRDDLRAGSVCYRYLDAAQLVKHAFGLTTQARSAGLEPILLYLFAEPAMLGERPIPDDAREAHREEIAGFAERVQGADVRFFALSYREWISTWRDEGAVVEHGRRLLTAFAP